MDNDLKFAKSHEEIGVVKHFVCFWSSMLHGSSQYDKLMKIQGYWMAEAKDGYTYTGKRIWLYIKF